MFREATVEELTSIALLFKKVLSGGDIHPLTLTISKTIAKKATKSSFTLYRQQKSYRDSILSEKVSYFRVKVYSYGLY
jgi:hypothetical protein